ncbi:MAG: hypothetical protein Q9164_005437, partial [Protoblastenia rupestris]
MAPLIKVLIQILPSVPNPLASFKPTTSLLNHNPTINNKFQTPITPSTDSQSHPHLLADATTTLSTVSWSSNRLDVFSLTANNLTHKYWDGYQWNPSDSSLETLGNGLATPPVATTWGPDRLHVFGLDDNSVLKHQYWDGTGWQPSVHELENLGSGCDSAYPIAASSWGEGRLDVFCTEPNGGLMHQFYDGSAWHPSTTGEMEKL